MRTLNITHSKLGTDKTEKHHLLLLRGGFFALLALKGVLTSESLFTLPEKTRSLYGMLATLLWVAYVLAIFIPGVEKVAGGIKVRQAHSLRYIIAITTLIALAATYFIRGIESQVGAALAFGAAISLLSEDRGSILHQGAFVLALGLALAAWTLSIPMHWTLLMIGTLYLLMGMIVLGGRRDKNQQTGYAG